MLLKLLQEFPVNRCSHILGTSCIYVYIYSSSLSHFQCTKPSTMKQWTVIKTGNKRRQSKTIYMQTRSFEFGIDDFITPLYNSAVRERDKPRGRYIVSMANNFPKNFQETVIFHLRQWRQPVEKRDLKKREGEKTRRGRGEKEREKKKNRKEKMNKKFPLC